MPATLSNLGALPARFRRPRVLIVGCGDVGLRAARRLVAQRVGVRALTSSPGRRPALRAAGVLPLAGNLDAPATLARLGGIAPYVLHLAPPPGTGEADPRTRALVAALRRRGGLQRLVYGSTSGVYGDCGGAWVDETRPVAPATTRARRRVDAERAVRQLPQATVLRIPGIYAPDRPGGTPRERLLRGTPALRAEDDVFTNHIQADDLARIAIAALWRGKPRRVVHASDASELQMGDYFDLAADLYGLPRPPRLARAELAAQVGDALFSFMSESRRLGTHRLHRELRVRLHHPTVHTGLLPKP